MCYSQIRWLSSPKVLLCFDGLDVFEEAGPYTPVIAAMKW